jgi:hypothetical protein
MLDDEHDPEKRFITVTVANVGRRTITIGHVGFTQRGRDSGDLLLGESLRGPREIAEGKSTVYVADQEGFTLANLARVVVQDQAGRVWKRRLRHSALKQNRNPA